MNAFAIFRAIYQKLNRDLGLFSGAYFKDIFFIKVFLINTSTIDQLTDRGKRRLVRKAQKLEHLKNEKSFFGKIRNISHNFREIYENRVHKLF